MERQNVGLKLIRTGSRRLCGRVWEKIQNGEHRRSFKSTNGTTASILIRGTPLPPNAASDPPTFNGSRLLLRRCPIRLSFTHFRFGRKKIKKKKQVKHNSVVGNWFTVDRSTLVHRNFDVHPSMVVPREDRRTNKRSGFGEPFFCVNHLSKPMPHNLTQLVRGRRKCAEKRRTESNCSPFRVLCRSRIPCRDCRRWTVAGS